MHISTTSLALVVCLFYTSTVRAKAVFAHYMVGTVYEQHAQQDIEDAIAMGLDGFVLNVGDPTQSYALTTLGYLFDYAANTNFKLFLSMDLSASGAACASGSACCNGPNDYQSILSQYSGTSTWYLGPNGKPMISSFSSGGFNNTMFSDWRDSMSSGMYFIPDFDETDGYYDAATGWWSYWGDVVDGLFSWEAAWPLRAGYGGNYPGDISPDMPVINGTAAHDKGYMIALSTLQYKDAYSTNLYRAGDLNLPTRMQNILSMSPQPDFVEIITWNDGPESHYIGNIWPESNTDAQPAAYATQTQFPHTAFQPLITAFINTWKSGGSASSMFPASTSQPAGAIWYKTILQNETCPDESQGGYYAQPDGMDTGRDALNWAVVVPAGTSGMQVRASSDGSVLQTVSVNPGLNFDSPTGVQTGTQTLELLDASGNVVASTGGGACIEADCPSGIFNMNLQVVELVQGGSGGACTNLD